MILWEGTTVRYRAILKDFDDTVLSAANIATMLVTLLAKPDLDIINLRDQQDVRNGGAWDKGVTFVTVDGVATLQFILTPSDNIIVNTVPVPDIETHVIIFEGTTAGSPSSSYMHVATYDIAKNYD